MPSIWFFLAFQKTAPRLADNLVVIWGPVDTDAQTSRQVVPLQLIPQIRLRLQIKQIPIIHFGKGEKDHYCQCFPRKWHGIKLYYTDSQAIESENVLYISVKVQPTFWSLQNQNMSAKIINCDWCGWSCRYRNITIFSMNEITMNLKLPSS